MNIIHVTTGLNHGGAEAVLYRLCTHDKQNRNTVISLMDSGKYGALLEASGIAVHCLGMPRGRMTLTGIGAYGGCYVTSGQTWCKPGCITLI